MRQPVATETAAEARARGRHGRLSAKPPSTWRSGTLFWPRSWRVLLIVLQRFRAGRPRLLIAANIGAAVRARPDAPRRPPERRRITRGQFWRTLPPRKRPLASGPAHGAPGAAKRPGCASPRAPRRSRSFSPASLMRATASARRAWAKAVRKPAMAQTDLGKSRGPATAPRACCR